MKKYSPLLYFIIFFIAICALLETRSFQGWVFSHTRVGYFYLSYDWEQKLAKALTQDLSSDVVFVGSSPTGFAINPDIISHTKEFDAHNFGLLGASQIEIERLLSVFSQSKSRFRHLFIEFNPLAIAARHIEINSSADYIDSLNFSKFESSIPLASWIKRQVPIVKYSGLYRVLLQDALKFSAPIKPMPYRKNQVHVSEFLSLVDSANGHIKNDYKLDRELKRYLVNQCEIMVNWNFHGVEQFTNSKAINSLNRTLEVARGLSDKVTVWIPPFPPSWKKIVGKEHYEQGVRIIKKGNVELLDFSDQTRFSDPALFVDCAHMNAAGSELLSMVLHKKID